MPLLQTLLTGAIVAASAAMERRQQQVHVQQWGANGVRVQIYPTAAAPANTSALGYLLPNPGNIQASQASGNIQASVGSDGRVTVTRPSDGATLLTQAGPLSVGAARTSAPLPPLSLTLAVGDKASHTRRFFGGGCRCGGGCEWGGGCGAGDGGNMINPGRNGSATAADLHFGTPIGNAPGPTAGGLGSQCGMMNGIPWIVAGGDASEGLAFGLFDNTQSWTYGTASSANQTIELTTPLGGASHIDFVVITRPASTPATGPARASAILGAYADALGHVPLMPKEVTGYWHSKDAIHSQQEAEEIVANFSALGLHVDVLVLDGPGYKACDSCTAFEPSRWPDPKSMVSRLKASNTYVMAHVHSKCSSRSHFRLRSNH